MCNLTYPEDIKKLPIYPELDSICNKLKESTSHFLVLTAETAAGKSTALPFALLKNFKGGIYMLEPRRIAVLNIAARVSELLGEAAGLTCGYQMHLENKTCADTRFTILTEAIIIKKLQSDPFLTGISVVVVDEFHERSIYSDLALAFLKEAMILRDDLFVIVMSATMDTDKLCSYLDAPLYTVKGRLYPVKNEYHGNQSVSSAVINELYSDEKGSILVFLPGISEIRKAYDEIFPHIDKDRHELLILHSSSNIKDQKYILNKSPDGKRRIILSSAIAETSITVPDVDLVIDCGLSRVNIYNPNIGMSHLVTVNESDFNAKQRAGRAGRIKEGRCIRLWSISDPRSESFKPEILRSDLSSLILECAAWGICDRDSVDLLDKPAESIWDAGLALLKLLGLLDCDGKLTREGAIALKLPLDPRLSGIVIYGLKNNMLDLCISLALKYSHYADVSQNLMDKAKIDIKDRVNKACIGLKFTINSTVSTGLSTDKGDAYVPGCLFHGFMDRVGCRISQDSHDYKLYSGRTARLLDIHCTPGQWIIALDVDAGDSICVIRDYVQIDDKEVLSLMEPYLTKEVVVSFNDNSNALDKSELTMYGKIIIKKSKLPVTEADYINAVCNEVKLKGLTFLPLDERTKSFMLRVRFYLENAQKYSAYNTLKSKYDSIKDFAADWLLPFVHTKEELNSLNVYNAVYYYLDGDCIDRLVPQEIILENGKKRKLVYEERGGIIKPVLEIIIQQIFGCITTPRIMGVNVLLKLLSPARRPLQVTEDLEGFWTGAWIEICKEMKGRYPKHNWDYTQSVKDL